MGRLDGSETMTRKEQLRIDEELYGTGFHDGYLQRKDVEDRMACGSLWTKADWRLWIAAAIGFVVGVTSGLFR